MDDLTLPTSVNTLGTWVKVKYQKEIPSHDGEYLHGLFIPDENKIIIRIERPEQMYMTLVHEICHAFFYYSGLGQTINEKQEESICCLFENLTKIFVINRAARYTRFKKRLPSTRAKHKRDTL